MGTRSRDGAYASSRRKQDAGRTASLCARVQRTLETVLDELSDERLSGVFVEDVTPLPAGGCLLVTLRRTPGTEAAREDTCAALAGAEGLLRTEVAAAIHRKRTPRLSYVVLDAGEFAVENEPESS